MARFDLYNNPNEETQESTPYVVDIQSDHVGALPTRVVIPIRRYKILGYSGSPVDLLPILVISGEKCFLDMPAMAAVHKSELGRKIGSLAVYREAISDAKERLFGSY